MKCTHIEILNAIRHIEKHPEVKLRRESFKYDLLFEGKRYPPILALSIANLLRGGEELTISDFGELTRIAFKILKDLGFVVAKKK